MAFKGRTIPLIWRKPYSNQWVANTPVASISIHHNMDGFTLYMAWMESYGNSEFSKETIVTSYEKLADAKERAQNKFDELFVPIAKKMRRKNYRSSKTAKKNRVFAPLCY